MAKRKNTPKPAPTCECCEEATAKIRLTACTLDGELLDGALACVSCATRRGFTVGAGVLS